jgi:hypothetical protein
MNTIVFIYNKDHHQVVFHEYNCIHVKLPDDGPCETETCSREVKVDHKQQT